MTTVRRLKAGEGALMRELRVASLRDSPSSFGRTLADALARRLGFGDAAR